VTRSPPTLLIGGFMGAGKTTIGELVATRLGAPFIDLDRAIEERAGQTIAALFSDGEAAFRRLECEELLRVLALPEPCVVALGGGALLDRALRREALERARVVTLTASTSALLARLEQSGAAMRPLLAGAGTLRARVEALLAARAEAYAEAHATVDTTELPPSDAAEAVAAAWQADAVAVPLGLRTYTATLASDGIASAARAVAALQPSAAFIVTDPLVGRLAGDALERALAERGVAVGGVVELAPGEASKDLTTVAQALTTLVGAGADRDAVIVALGGGAVSDVAGFVASTLLRGVRWVGVPTTLLAMVDASIGGKTGVDVGAAKNAAGAFHQPSAVVIDPRLVATESARAYRSGLAEAVKAAAIDEPALLGWLEAHADSVLARDEASVRELIARSIAVKARIVARDERERGERAVLNFGHTIGHALEAAGGYRRLTHGEAVSIGMAAILRLGCALGVTASAVAERVVGLLMRLGLPVDVDRDLAREASALLALDKKRRGGDVRVVLLADVGRPELHLVALGELAGWLDPDELSG
jgi:shikimate kinase/3-dehydroquinate synthase